jgi:hypothetical protein
MALAEISHLALPNLDSCDGNVGVCIYIYNYLFNIQLYIIYNYILYLLYVCVCAYDCGIYSMLLDTVYCNCIAHVCTNPSRC